VQDEAKVRAVFGGTVEQIEVDKDSRSKMPVSSANRQTGHALETAQAMIPSSHRRPEFMESAHNCHSFEVDRLLFLDLCCFIAG